MLVRGSSVLEVVLVLMVVKTGHSGHSRLARQASKCHADEPCELLNTCQFYQDLLSNSPSAADIAKMRENICDNTRRRTKVCCPKATPTKPTPPTPTPTPRTVSPAGPTPTVDPAVGEALLPTNCGRTRTSTKIFFGENAVLGEYPWMANLGYGNRQNPTWGCGGALITDQYVLSAGHCLDSDFTGGQSVVLIRLGEHNLATVKDCESNSVTSGQLCAEPVQDFAPAALYKNHNFNTRLFSSDDISLIKLEKKATLNLFVQPICLPAAGFDVKAFLGTKNATVAGWGRTQVSQSSDLLQKVNLPLFDYDKCKTLYSSSITAEELCFGGSGMRDSCSGDSGGPLFAFGGPGIPHYTLIGVVSRGKAQCGTVGTPAIYTNVASYRSWILQNLHP
nr:prophenoloxidase-activating enzyme 2a [Cherax quadricarinatus]